VSINPGSDIVLEVIRAADPAKSRAAAEKLLHFHVTDKAVGASFDHILVHTTPQPQASGNEFPANSVSLAPAMDARTKAYKGLEQLVLKNLVDSMLPQGSVAFFGSGAAGDIWRSQLADQLAAEMSRTADLRLFNRRMSGNGPHISPAQASLPSEAAT
jgi:hypothetical protein